MPSDEQEFRKPPRGVAKWFLHAPAYLFRLHLGFMFGRGILVITHIGRKSGKLHETPVQVIEHADAEYFVIAGRGPTSQWYRNLLAAPAASIQVGNRSWRPVQRMVPPDEAERRLADFARRHPRAARAITPGVPMVAFSESPAE